MAGRSTKTWRSGAISPLAPTNSAFEVRQRPNNFNILSIFIQIAWQFVHGNKFNVAFDFCSWPLCHASWRCAASETNDLALCLQNSRLLAASSNNALSSFVLSSLQITYQLFLFFCCLVVSYCSDMFWLQCSLGASKQGQQPYLAELTASIAQSRMLLPDLGKTDRVAAKTDVQTSKRVLSEQSALGNFSCDVCTKGGLTSLWRLPGDVPRNGSLLRNGQGMKHNTDKYLHVVRENAHFHNQS